MDGLRALAVTAVMVHHFAAFLAPTTFEWLLPGGFLGVDVFFVLSGYLITSIVKGNMAGSAPWVADFCRRRAWRLVPGMVALLCAVTLAALLGMRSSGDLVGSWVSALLYVFNWAWLGPLVPNEHLHHLWSLSAEGQFYVVWPALLVVARGRAVAVAVVGISLVLAWRGLLFKGDWSAVYFRTDTRLDAFLVGGLVALAPSFRVAMARYAPIGAGLLAVALAVAQREDPWLYEGGLTLVALAAATLVAAAVEGGSVARALARPLLVRVGVLSYSLYLWHYPIFRMLADVPAAIVMAPAVTAVVAMLSHRYVEMPFLRRRDQARSVLLRAEAEGLVLP